MLQDFFPQLRLYICVSFLLPWILVPNNINIMTYLIILIYKNTNAIITDLNYWKKFDFSAALFVNRMSL